MAESDLVASLDRLEKIFDAEHAAIHVNVEGNNVVIEGNRDGLLSVAISLLQAAKEQPSDIGNIPNLHSIKVKQVSADSDDLFFLAAVHRTDDLLGQAVECSQRRASLTDRICLAGCGLVGFLLAMTMLGGLIFWFRMFVA